MSPRDDAGMAGKGKQHLQSISFVWFRGGFWREICSSSNRGATVYINKWSIATQNFLTSRWVRRMRRVKEDASFQD